MGALLRVARLRTLFLAGVVVLLLGAMALVAVKWVRVKMLPVRQQERVPGHRRHARGHDARADRSRHAGDRGRDPHAAGGRRTTRPTSGPSGPYNFNGLVRHYFLRQGSNVADIQVNLVEQGRRARRRATRSPSACATRSRRSPTRFGAQRQGRRGAARAAGARDAGRRDLRARLRRARSRSPGRSASMMEATDGRRRRRLVRRGRPAEVSLRRRPGEGGARAA